MTLEIVFVSGMLTGLAGSLHCAGLCGGVASVLVPARAGQGLAAAHRLSFLLKLQLGRAAVYVGAGGVMGGLGYSAQSLVPVVGLQEILRLIAAVLIAMTGLSVAGILPPVGRLHRLLPYRPRLRRPVASPFLLGSALAMAPCAMALNAVMTALFTGGALSGAIYMTGFSLAALPGVVLTAFGVAGLAGGKYLANSRLRFALGMLLVGCGVGFALVPAVSLTDICFSG